MKKMVTIWTAVLAFAFTVVIAGCSGTQQEKSASVLVEMQALKAQYVKDKVPAGLGIGISKDEQIAMEKADQNARVDLAKELDVRMKALTKNFKEDVGGDIAEHFQSASKSIVDTRMNGATLTDVKVEVMGDTLFKVYGIMTLGTDLVSEYLKSLQGVNAENEALKNKIRAAADKAYAEIDAATAK